MQLDFQSPVSVCVSLLLALSSGQPEDSWTLSGRHGLNHVLVQTALLSELMSSCVCC